MTFSKEWWFTKKEWDEYGPTECQRRALSYALRSWEMATNLEMGVACEGQDVSYAADRELYSVVTKLKENHNV